VHTCVICRFEVELDDAVVPTASGLCVCVRCFARETDSGHLMDKEFRREIVDVLDALDAIGSV
jgi:hypothetical protein